MVLGSTRNWIAVNAVQQSILNERKNKNMTTPHLRKSIGRSPLRLDLPRVQPIWIIRSFLLIPLVLGCFALSPTARALLPAPAPDGGYPSGNTAEGADALFNLTTGVRNTATGYAALYNNTTGSFNTANGFYALERNTTGTQNTATGDSALELNTTGGKNTATGVNALLTNSTGTQNTATGAFALQNNNATNNTADGFQALFSNTSGTQNTATGESALKSNTTASNNTADGFQVLFHNTTGAGNTAVGFHALVNNSNGSSNIALGLNAGTNLTTGSNNIDIGNSGAGGESNTTRIGSVQVRTFIKGISGVGVTGTAVVVNAAGQLGTAPSSARFKNEIKPMDKASEAIIGLKPVTFRYKKELDPDRNPQFGLVAEDVAKVNPDLVVRDAEGKVYTVRYEAVNAMLLNEFLKEHRTVQELKKEIAALTATVQKVTAQVEMSRPAPQTVVNNH
jgi:Chaperone of endosialidase